MIDCNSALEWMRESFYVYPERGSIVWRNPPCRHPRLVGTEAGSPHPSNSGKRYQRIKMNGKTLKRGWLIFLWCNGRWPSPLLDHIDGNSENDAVGNLREATQMQNAWNHKKRAKKSPLPMGVRLASSGRFVARISVNKRHETIGVFDTANEASAAYQSKRREYFDEYA